MVATRLSVVINAIGWRVKASSLSIRDLPALKFKFFLWRFRSQAPR